MSDLLLHYGLIALEIICSIACLILYIFKKNKIILKDTAFEKVLEKLPFLISQAEVAFKDGLQKKTLVLSVAMSLLAAETDLSFDELSAKYGDRLEEAIENILNTPQKKEVIKL